MTRAGRSGSTPAKLGGLVDNEGAQEEKEDRVPNPLHRQRLETVAALLKDRGGTRILDLGCGDGKLLALLSSASQFTRLLGVDVSLRQLAFAESRLEEANRRQPGRVEFLQGSLVYRDQRMQGFDAVALIEVVEHLDPSSLATMERVVFEFAAPRLVVVTTPNADYNVLFANLSPEKFRHRDHRFEWRRFEFLHWAEAIGSDHGHPLTRTESERPG